MIQDTMLGDMFEIWFSSQSQLSKVERWGRFRENNPDLRKQSTEDHQYSVCLAILPVLIKLKEYYFNHLNTELVKDAFILHDLPEGFLEQEKDISSVSKKSHHDLEEHNAFCKKILHFKKNDKFIYDYYMKAYLLQFCHKDDQYLSVFPESSMEVIKNIRIAHPYEVSLFPALEQWEYLFYAYEGYIDKQDISIFVNVLRNQVPNLQKHAKNIHGFREVVFPIHFEEKLLSFMNEYSHVERV
ncbi:MAG: hypothetical protein NTX85_00045 [Candidatus Nomurabacteria bacterium]|nr:hypothetical protein [Candidatus Nomurabacteria bacterium]